MAPGAAQARRYNPFDGLEPVNLHQARKIAEDAFDIDWVPNFISSPGLGKSAVAKQIAADRNLFLIDRRVGSMVPEDINGLPDFVTMNGIRRATYSPMSFWPLATDDIPEGYSGWLLLMDEYNSGNRAMQAATYTVILDHRVGDLALHPKCKVMTAGNLMTDNAIVEELGTASQSRMTHVPVKVCNETWHFWADAHNIDVRVKAFIKFKPTALHAFDPNHTDLTFPCPRTWETTSKFVSLWGAGPMDKVNRPAISGTIGNGMAREFYNFTKVWKELPTIGDIIANPTGYNVPSAPDLRHAITSLIGESISVHNADDLMKYILRLPPDHQVTCLRQAIGRDIALLRHQAIATWTKTNRTRLIQKSL
jgi:hypothetical protein